ncbi:Centromere protein U [Plecturocebus cupreus]
MSYDKRKKSGSEAVDSDTSNTVHMCLDGKKTSDIMEMNIVLPEFGKVHQENAKRIESKICKAAMDTFYYNVKEQITKLPKESQMLRNLKRKNAKMISDIEKKRQHMIEVQDELLRREPQLKKLQIKYDELRGNYSDVKAKEPKVKEMYDSSSLPALLFKARTLLGAESHLQNVNHQLEKLLDQE